MAFLTHQNLAWCLSSMTDLLLTLFLLSSFLTQYKMVGNYWPHALGTSQWDSARSSISECVLIYRQNVHATLFNFKLDFKLQARVLSWALWKVWHQKASTKKMFSMRFMWFVSPWGARSTFKKPGLSFIFDSGIQRKVPLIFTVSYVSSKKEYSFSEVVECLWEVQVRQHMACPCHFNDWLFANQ